MNLPSKIKQDHYNPESREDEIIGIVNSLISFLEEKFPQSDEPKDCGLNGHEVRCQCVFMKGVTTTATSDDPKRCKHQFWRDRNPAGCMNCGKTEEELYAELSKSKELPHWESEESEYDFLKKQKDKILSDKQPHWESDYAAIWEKYHTSDNSYILNDARQDILELVRGLMKV